MVIWNEVTLVNTLGGLVDSPSSQLRRKIWATRYDEGKIESEANASDNAEDMLTDSRQSGK